MRDISPLIAAYSHGLAACAYAALAWALMSIWRERQFSRALAWACVFSVIWAGSVASLVWLPRPFWGVLELSEWLRTAGWLFFLLVLHPIEQGSPTRGQWRRHPLANLSFWVLFALLALSLWGWIWGFPAEQAALWVSVRLVGRIALSILGVLLIEHLLRTVPSEGRWGIKLACLGIGTLFVYDFYLYTDALLFRAINPEIWAARGLVDALVPPLVALSVARNPRWTQGLWISRRVLFHSVTLFAAASYLLLMALAGYALRYFGGNWGSVMQAAFLFAAVLLLLALLFSGAFRAWLKVFISKHFYNYNYDYRDEWIALTRALSEKGPDLAERAVRAICDLVQSPGGVLYLCKEGGHCVAAGQWNFPPELPDTPLSPALCALFEARQWIVDVHNMNDEVYAQVALPDWLRQHSRAWLILPLILHGKVFGVMVLAAARSKVLLNWEVLDLLRISGTQAASYLAQQEAARALMVARQFESFNRMSTFMVHDLKNLVAQLSLLLANAEKHRDNPEFQQDMVDTIEHAVQKMKVLLQKLARGAAEDKSAPQELNALLARVVASKRPYQPRPDLLPAAAPLLVRANAERLERVLGHLLQNAIEATPHSGRVEVRVRAHAGLAHIEIADSGAGMSEAFIRDKLFAPFVSTKVAGMGIGVFETREYIEELGGRISVQSQPGAGSTFLLSVPLCTPDVPQSAQTTLSGVQP